MLTTIMGWLGRHFGGRGLSADELRADRMDAAWQPEYRQLGNQERPVHVRVPRLFYR